MYNIINLYGHMWTLKVETAHYENDCMLEIKKNCE